MVSSLRRIKTSGGYSQSPERGCSAPPSQPTPTNPSLTRRGVPRGRLTRIGRRGSTLKGARVGECEMRNWSGSKGGWMPRMGVSRSQASTRVQWVTGGSPGPLHRAGGCCRQPGLQNDRTLDIVIDRRKERKKNPEAFFLVPPPPPPPAICGKGWENVKARWKWRAHTRDSGMTMPGMGAN